MMDNIDEVTNKRLEALEEIIKDKRRVARAYNKKVRAKCHTRFYKENRMHLICAPGSFTHT
jgi:hypothetical protein